MLQPRCPNPECTGGALKTRSNVIFLEKPLLARWFVAGGSLVEAALVLPVFAFLALVFALLGQYFLLLAIGLALILSVLALAAAYPSIAKLKVYKLRCGRCGYTWGRADIRPELSQARLRWYERMVARFRKSKRAQIRAAFLVDLGGLLASYTYEYDRAAALCEESLGLFRQVGDRRGTALALNNLGYIRLLQGDLAGGRRLVEESVAICRADREWQCLAYALNSLGFAAQLDGDDQAAATLFAEGMALKQALGIPESIAFDLHGLARDALNRGQTERAARLFGASESLREAQGYPLPPIQRSRYQAAIEALRRQLGESRFAAAWGAGWAMAPGEAIAYALAA